MYRADYTSLREFYSRLIRTAREEKGKSREEMSELMGVSSRTIINWEEGYTMPGIDVFTMWMETLGIDMTKYIRANSRPPHTTDENSLTMDAGLVTLDLHRAIDDMDVDTKRKMHFLIYGNHGGSFDAYMDKSVADVQCPMHDRHNTSLLAISNYEYARAIGYLKCPDEVQPDLDRLTLASKMGRDAALTGNDSYAMPIVK